MQIAERGSRGGAAKRATLFVARTLLIDSTTQIADGGLLVVDGVVQRVLTRRAEVRRVRASHVIELGEGVVAPGWVNAHAHLELGPLVGRTPRGGDFGAWVRAVLAAKASLAPGDFAAAVDAGVEELLASGCTSSVDIVSMRSAEPSPRRALHRRWVMREVLDAHDPSRTNAALARVGRALRPSSLRREGLSPHAPFTVSPMLLAACFELARRRRVPLTMHWSETAAEVEWMRAGTGALAALLGRSPQASALDSIEALAPLRVPLSLVHGNCPERGEPARVARLGAVVVHCPGSHAWFDRPPFPLARYRRAGVRLALGTDSRASNERLDMRREMRLLRLAHPELAPQRVFEMATEGGAAALGLERRIGVLRPGAVADFALHRCSGAVGAVLDALTAGECVVESSWVAGRCAWRREGA